MTSRIVTDCWADRLPPAMDAGLGQATRACLLEPVSLTDRLVGSGRAFAVEVQYLGQSAAGAEEAGQVNAAAGDPLLERQVALNLDGTTVVVARSYCRWECPVWTPVLDRGSRSLGYTLFSGEVPVGYGPLEFLSVTAGHPLFAQAALRAPGPASYPARRRRFVLNGAAMVVCEVFLPALEARMQPEAGNQPLVAGA